MISCDGGDNIDIKDEYFWVVDGDDIQVCKDTGVTGIERDNIFKKVADIYDFTLDNSQRATFRAKVTKINITADGPAITHSGSVLFIRRDADRDSEIEQYILLTLLVKNQQKNNIMIAKNNELDYQNYLKHMVVLPQIKKILTEKRATEGGLCRGTMHCVSTEFCD
jgi:hypothetical protein